MFFRNIISRLYEFSDHSVKYINVEQLCCTPEISIIFYINYILILKKDCMNHDCVWSQRCSILDLFTFWLTRFII